MEEVRASAEEKVTVGDMVLVAVEEELQAQLDESEKA